MTKKICLAFISFIGICHVLTAQQIATSNTMSLDELIQNTLGQGCVEISNISSTIDGSIDDITSFGRFTKENSNFPFQNGLVLTTGAVSSAGNGLNTDPLNEGTTSWETDPDLEAALGLSGTLNATSIEFDFISATNGIAFNYLFASEEYFGTNPCRYSDTFVFLIKESGSSEPYRNIALIPGTSLPVNTTNIRPKIDGFCPAENPTFFEGYNIGDTNYNGRTTVLKASASIIPNVKYHIKIVIADQIDPGLDSAVFIEGHSFNATLDLGPDIKTCANSTVLNTNIPNGTYKWFKDGILITNANSESLNVTQSGSYKVQVTLPLGNSFCKLDDEINVTLNVQETLANIPDYVLCDDPSNLGKQLFDLTSRDDDVLQGLPSSNNYKITYHLTFDEAKSGDNPIITIENTQNPQDIFIRINDVINNCASLSGVRLIVNQSPIINKPDLLEICDTDAILDGFTEIDLKEVDSQITSNYSENSDLYVTYHTNPVDANSGENAIVSPYTNTSTNQTLHVRLYDSITGCFSTTTLNISVSTSPIVAIEKPYINACNQNGNGFATFDLTAELDTILDGLTDVSSSFHVTYSDAEEDKNAITNPSSYHNIQSELQEVYIRLVNDQSGCFTITPLELHANIALTGLYTGDFNGCDNLKNGIVDFDLNAVEGQLLNNYKGFDVEFFESANAQQNNDVPLDKTIPYTMSSSPSLIYATVTSPDCIVFIPIRLVINPPVTLPDSFTLEYCDRNQDGYTEVLLASFDVDVSNGITAPIIQYYANRNDAENDVNAFGPSINVNRKRTIYVRITNSNTSCYDVAPLTINILDAPINTGPYTLPSACNADQNGYAFFNLENSISYLVQDPTKFKITFHRNYNLAVAGTSPIQEPSNYYGRSQYIAVRIENANGCFSIAAIYLIANTPPIIPQISNFQNCTSDGSSISEFYFYQKDEEILNGQIDKEVLYFETEADAHDRVNIIDKNSAFRNTPTISQTIYVRMEAVNDPTCYAISSFVLEVDNLPPFNEATDVFLCDDLSANGIVTYNLQLKEQEIKKDIAQSIGVTFYTSNEDAKNEINPIIDLNFTNTTNPQSIYARIDNGTFCFSMTSFSINVVPLPKAEAPSDLYFCDTNLSGQGIFDLEVVKILDLRPQGIEITFHESLQGAETDSETILDPKNYLSTSSLQTVYAKIKNTVSSDACFITLPINLNIVSPPTVNDFKEYSICENPDNNFNLDAIDSQLTVASNILITYFSSRSAAIANDINTELNSNYTYNSPNDRIYARLENTITGCISYYDFELIVTPLPIANKAIDLQGCDDDYDGVLVFDLSYEKTPEILGAQSPSNLLVTYHETPQAAHDGAPVLNNLYGATDLQIIYVRVLNTNTGCYSTTQFSIIIHPKPIINIPDQAICSDNPSSSVIVNAETDTSTDTYLWSTGATTSEIEINAIGAYSVTVTGDFGCQTTQDFNVLTYETATIEVVETVDFSDPNNIIITISGNGDYLYILDDGPPQESNVFKNVTLGYHTVTVIDAIGCTEISKEVVVVDAPKFVTPNNDGYFDTWHISGIETLPGSVINIFDRYGKFITTLTSSSLGWDGTYKGYLLPASDYWYSGKIKKNNNTFEVKGHFALVR